MACRYEVSMVGKTQRGGRRSKLLAKGSHSPPLTVTASASVTPTAVDSVTGNSSPEWLDAVTNVHVFHDSLDESQHSWISGADDPPTSDFGCTPSLMEKSIDTFISDYLPSDYSNEHILSQYSTTDSFNWPNGSQLYANPDQEELNFNGYLDTIRELDTHLREPVPVIDAAINTLKCSISRVEAMAMTPSAMSQHTITSLALSSVELLMTLAEKLCATFKLPEHGTPDADADRALVLSTPTTSIGRFQANQKEMADIWKQMLAVQTRRLAGLITQVNRLFTERTSGLNDIHAANNIVDYFRKTDQRARIILTNLQLSL
ncbi:hypothetical protein CAC42_6859 [Sphaceloma murrayae]|uniref:Uncharacterized protein n=1 Tax=Sphaceloma murrayae TaxID=2082308 RepID=A0A2K1QGQ7_9PEZI|nr:hypothetical protein CAC42_6859 [Sphaceloma murrayae]